MTNIANILDELKAHGIRAYRLDGEHVRLIPREAVTPAIAARVRAAKPDLLLVLPPAPMVSAPPVFDYFSSRYADLFVDLSGDVGGMPGDLQALEWAERHGWPSIVDTLRAVDRRCEALAAADDEAGFRAAVTALVETFRAIRAAYAAAVEAGEMNT